MYISRTISAYIVHLLASRSVLVDVDEKPTVSDERKAHYSN